MQIIGHRGARGLAPENTLAGLKAALAAGVDGIEFDVRVTRDGAVVLAHGKKTKNADGAHAHVLKNSYAELKKFYPNLTTFEEAVRLVNRRVPLYVELKPGIDPARVAAVVEKLLGEKWQPGDFYFLSFEYKLLKYMQQRFPDCGLVVNDMWSGVRACARARRLGTDMIDMYRPFLWRGFIKAATKRGFKLFTFTQNDVAQAQRWAAAGLAGVITDYPDRFKKGKTK